MKQEPESLATVETLTHYTFIRNLPPGHNPSHRVNRYSVSVDKLWTRLLTDAHTSETAATYVHAHKLNTWLWISTRTQCVQRDVWDLAGCRKWQRSAHLGMSKCLEEKFYCGIKMRADETWTCSCSVCTHTSPSWRHPHSSVRYKLPSTTWDGISFVSNHSKAKKSSIFYNQETEEMRFL